ncbi:MAG: segregation/condensation protein A [Oscillospiraceae bacterium]|jgi:segregation and condensation protein A|nr:segregation/condensation protein A [Oscillospiraceae bacterium]
MTALAAPQYKLGEFEGPLDLLLHLVSKHKLDILDVPILGVIGQYLAYVQAAREEDLDLAGSFLEMAARLLYIKSLTLLPRQDELEDLTQELREEILGYRDCKMLADKLRAEAVGFDYLPRDGEPATVADMTYTRLHEASELLRWYFAAVGRKKRKLPPPAQAFSGILAHKIVSVGERARSLLEALAQNGKALLDKLLRTAGSRSELVATFLAILALAKSRNLHLEGEGGKVSAVLLKHEWVDDGCFG